MSLRYTPRPLFTSSSVQQSIQIVIMTKDTTTCSPTYLLTACLHVSFLRRHTFWPAYHYRRNSYVSIKYCSSQTHFAKTKRYVVLPFFSKALMPAAQSQKMICRRCASKFRPQIHYKRTPTCSCACCSWSRCARIHDDIVRLDTHLVCDRRPHLQIICEYHYIYIMLRLILSLLSHIRWGDSQVTRWRSVLLQLQSHRQQLATIIFCRVNQQH